MKLFNNYAFYFFLILLALILAQPATAQTVLGQPIPLEFSNSQDAFSISLNGDGTRVAVGRSRANNPGFPAGVGSVQVFDFDGTDWQQLGNTFYGTQSQEYLGTSVDLSADGTVLIMGAPRFSTSSLQRAGRFQTAVWTGSFWNTNDQVGIFNIYGQEQFGEAGHSVARADAANRVIMGVHLANDPLSSSFDEGTVAIWDLDVVFGGYRRLNGSNPPYGDSPQDKLGWKVDISNDGTIFAMGTPFNNYAKVYTFIPDDPSNPQLGAFFQVGSNITGTSGVRFSEELALSGDGQRLIISSKEDNGSVHTYDFINGDWVEVGTALRQVYQTSVSSSIGPPAIDISDDGTVMAVGSPFEFDPANNNSVSEGAIRIYQWINNDWVPVGNPVYGEEFRVGKAVAVANDGTVVAGAGLNSATVAEAASVLPITLQSFTAEPADKAVRLAWQTAAEENTQNFTLERSTDGGRTFTLIGSVPALDQRDGAAYSFVDNDLTLTSGTLYYRLQARDFDGTTEYFGPVAVTLAANPNQAIQVIPNPVAEDQVIQLQGAAAGAIIELISMNGQRLATLTATTGGRYQLPQVPAGVYLVRSLSADDSGAVARLVIR